MIQTYYLEFVFTPNGAVKKLMRDISSAANLAEVFDMSYFVEHVFRMRGFFLKAISGLKVRLRLVCWSYACVEDPYSKPICRALAFKKIW